MEETFDEVGFNNTISSHPTAKDAISHLNELGPAIKVEYKFHQVEEGFICQALMFKDRESFDCYGVSKKKQEAKLIAASEALALLKLLFPMVPLAMYNKAPRLQATYFPVDSFNLKANYVAYYFREIKSGNVFVYVNKEQKNYVVLSNPSSRPELVIKPECPLDLLNDPIRFTDWSQGPICVAQDNYISRRLELLN